MHSSNQRAVEAARQPSRRLIAIAALGCGFLLGVALVTRSGLFTTDIVIAPTLPPVEDLSAEEADYYDFMAPRLRELSAEATYLAEFGAERRRNLVELQSHADRLSTLVNEINAFVLERGVPERFAAVDMKYREGVALTVQAMRDARQGLLRLDFDQVEAAVDLFARGAGALDDGVALLDQAGGFANPTSPVAMAMVAGVDYAFSMGDGCATSRRASVSMVTSTSKHHMMHSGEMVGHL